MEAQVTVTQPRVRTRRRATKADKENQIIQQAMEILESRCAKYDVAMDSAEAAKNLVRAKLRTRKQEVFLVLFLNNQHMLIEAKEMFYGTIDGASVYPREVVRESLELNAAAVILAHNHPSGVSTPSQADLTITDRLRDALALIDVRVLDHLIVGDTTTSFAQQGLLK